LKEALAILEPLEPSDYTALYIILGVTGGLLLIGGV